MPASTIITSAKNSTRSKVSPLAVRPSAARYVRKVADRLSSELRLAQAADIDSANVVLRKCITDYNGRFARIPRETESAWRPAPEQLERICSFLHERTVSNDNVVQWDGRRLQIPPQNRRFSFAGAKIQLYQALDGRVSLYAVLR